MTSEPPEELSRLPADLVDSLTDDQRSALAKALRTSNWTRHPVNVRLSLPVFGRRGIFLTFVGGAERRSPERLQRERRIHRLGTVGNILFVVAVGLIFYLLAVISLLLLHRVIEF